MKKNQYREVIKFFVLVRLSPTENHIDLVELVKESARPFATVHGWVLEFKCIRQKC